MNAINRFATIGLSMIAGAVLGGATIQVLHAQAKTPVYSVTLQTVSNQDALNKEFVPPARAAVRQYGGKPVAGGKPMGIEGAVTSDRVVVNQWESADQAKKFYGSPEYQKARDIGNKYAKFQIMLVDGIPAQ